MILTATTIVIFLLTTVAFTGLLVRNIEQQTLSELETNVRVLAYSIESKKAEVLSDAQVAAQNPQIIAATRDKTRNMLADITSTILLAKKESTLVVTGDTGQVLARGEDRDRAGDSLSDDPLIKRALLGESTSSIVSKNGVVAPSLYIYGASPIRDGTTIVGAVLTGSAIDPAFVDGMKAATGLESAIYGDTVVSATTLTAPDGVTRLIGMKLNRSDITSVVLGKNEKYSGALTLANTPYFGAFLPLTDVDNNPVGMILIGKPQISSLATAGRSIELTFLITVALIIFSIAPTYMIAKYIANQLS
jgi:sensor histidine kinase regulating citrate/malate metabolism